MQLNRYDRLNFFGSLVLTTLFPFEVISHHSIIGIYDSNQTVEITGQVQSVSWRNPHGLMLISTIDASGNPVEWEVETVGISILRNRKIDLPDIPPRSSITIAGYPSTRNIPVMLARNILLEDGYELDFFNSPYFDSEATDTRVQPELENTNSEQAGDSAKGIFRVWSTVMDDPASFPLFKGGYPLTDAAQNAMKLWNPRANSLLRCNSKGMPLIMITPFPIDFVPDGTDILMRIEEFDVRRHIHMSTNVTAPTSHTQFGFSRGHWEGRTLVISTDHILAGYFDLDGAPQSDQITVLERFTPNQDYDRLDYRVTVSDPINFTEPFDLERYFIWVPENSVHPYECLDQGPSDLSPLANYTPN